MTRRFDSAPDPHLIPEGLRALAAEVTDLRARFNQASARIGALASNQLDHKALTADRAEVGAAVRAGKTPKSLTPHADKLKADREAAVLEKERLAAARQSVNTEVCRWLEDNADDLLAFTAAQRDAAAEAFRAAVAAANEARHAWAVANEAHAWAERATGPDSAVAWLNPLARLDDGPIRALLAQAEQTKRVPHTTSAPGFDR